MESQKSFVEWVKLEALARPAFEEAAARFREATKSYQEIKDNLQSSIRFTLNEYCKIFGSLDQRYRALKEKYNMDNVSHNSVNLIDYVDKFKEIDLITDITSTIGKLYASGFSTFHWLQSGVNFDPYYDEDAQIVIPTRYLGIGGIQLMREEAIRITCKMDIIEAEDTRGQLQQKEAIERTKSELLQMFAGKNSCSHSRI